MTGSADGPDVRLVEADDDAVSRVPRKDRTRLPFTRLDNGDPWLMEQLVAAVEDVVYRGDFTLGAELEAFEEDFAGYCGTAAAVGVSSGTDALALALRALDVGPGHEVIVPANSFIATAEAVTLAGARPRLVDVDAGSHLLTAEILERHVTRRTRCVIPVHLEGRTVDLDPIMALARRHGFAVVEDACQAHGALYRGHRVGSVGDCGCFSFYPTKNLGGWGDGGAVVTNDPLLAERVRMLRSHGEIQRRRHRVASGTFRLDTVQAAVLRAKLPLLDRWNHERRRVGAALTAALEGTPLALPAPPPRGGDHVYHLYVVGARDRDGLQAHLRSRAIASAVHYPIPIHLTEAYAHLGMSPGSLPVCERLAARICSLPMFPAMRESDVERIASAVRDFTAPRSAKLSASKAAPGPPRRRSASRTG